MSIKLFVIKGIIIRSFHRINPKRGGSATKVKFRFTLKQGQGKIRLAFWD
jgi:hypothetical protein